MNQDKRDRSAETPQPPPAGRPSAPSLLIPAAVAVAVLGVLGWVGLGQQLVSIKEDQQAIRQELAELKGLLGGRPPAAAAAAAPAAPEAQPMIGIAGARFKGQAGAKVTLVEFSDYQCPFCARHVKNTIPELERDYIRTGKLKYVYRNYPIASSHPLAAKAAEAAECAGDQDRFWELHDVLYANQGQLSAADLTTYARQVGVNLPDFQTCLDGGRHAEKVKRDLAAGSAAGVNGTPAFFLGLSTTGNGEFKAVKVIRGAHPYQTFKAAIDELLGRT